jgi:predicted RNA-binding Zn ribbon-like protein
MATRDLPIVGGHLALDFANTVDDPEGPARHDHAATYAGLVHWAVDREIVSRDQAAVLLRKASRRPTDAAAALRAAHRLRRVVGSVFTDVANGTPVRTRDWNVLRRHTADAYETAILDWDGGRAIPSWHDSDRMDAPLSPIAVAAVELLGSSQLARVKRCAGCPWLFLDRSKNGSRRWCAMNDCGTHEKIRRYVARRAEQRTRVRNDDR